MIFRSVRLENWRNFREAHTTLASRVFIVGANASGKSNLLDVFRFLRDIVKSGGGFVNAIKEERGGVTKIRSLSATQKTDITIEVEVGSTDPGELPLWNYRLVFNQDNVKRPEIKEEVLYRNGNKLISRPAEEDEKDPERLRQTWLEQLGKNQDFREFVNFLRTVHYLHLVPQLIREPGRALPRKNDPFGSDFLEALKRTSLRTREARLRRIGETLKRAIPQLEELTFDVEEDEPHLKARYKNWRARGVWQREDQLSDGTIRLIGLLWAILDGDGPLLLEEPELSLHTAVVRRLAPLIYRAQRIRGKGARQVIVSTHSYDLLDEPGISGEEVLLLIPDDRGTTITSGKDDAIIKALLDAGVTAAGAAFPRTEPADLAQLIFDW